MPHLLLFIEALMVCLAAGLLIVRSATPQLSGVGWVSAAFLAGALCPLALLYAPPELVVPMTSIAILLALVLFHTGVLAVSDSKSMVPRFGIALMLIEIAVWLMLSKGLSLPWARLVATSALPAAQAIQTGWQVMIGGRVQGRAPSWMVAVVLFLLAVLNVMRIALQVFPASEGATAFGITDTSTYAAYLMAGMGLAFGFFWLTAIGLSMKLDEQGGRDPLTKALNRRHFLQSCEQERERTFRNGGCFSVMMVDIDHFKSINDTFGHSVGDTVICDVVDRIRDSVRGIDLVGRWGGEEFIILVREQGKSSAMQVAERMRSKVQAMDSSATAIRYGNHRQITCSIGTATFKGNETIVELVERADQALYKAKAAGRNRVVADSDEVTLVPEAPEKPRRQRFLAQGAPD